MASLLSSSSPSPHLILLSKTSKTQFSRLQLSKTQNPFPKFPVLSHSSISFSVASYSGNGGEGISDEWGEKSPPEQKVSPSVDPTRGDDEWGQERESSKKEIKITDEWGEKSDPDPEPISAPDPPTQEDEWGNGSIDSIPSSSSPSEESQQEQEEIGDLKQCLIDSVYGTELGFRASAELRAEVFELISQLEAANPNLNPVEKPELFDGNWILVYTAFSELVPLLAAGSTPLLKVKEISQEISTSSRTIVNKTTLSNPFASFSFSATASFEVVTASRIQVQFKEGTLDPPQISSTIDLPPEVNIFNQKISLGPVQQLLTPLQNVFLTISRAISGQTPVKLPIPGGNRAESWLLTTFLDEDFRVSRGDGGLFVLVKEGSPLLDQVY